MPHQPILPSKRRFARTMRRAPTDAGNKLWQDLRSRRLNHLKFRRQFPIGPFIADFACLPARLLVELDGSQHADAPSDILRTTHLQSRGFRVLRFWNDDVLRDVSGVCDTIIAFCRDPTLQPWR